MDSESIEVLIFVCVFYKGFVIKGRELQNSYNWVVLLRPDILPMNPGPYVCSTGKVLERKANLTPKKTQI